MQQKQFPLAQGGDYNQNSTYDTNSYNQNQGQHLQQQQYYQQYENSNQSLNQMQNNNGVKQDQYIDQKQIHAANSQIPHQIQYQNPKTIQQKQQIPPSQNISFKNNQQQHQLSQNQGNQAPALQPEQYQQFPHQPKQNQQNSNPKPLVNQQYDSQGRPLQMQPHIQYQMSHQEGAINSIGDQNISKTGNIMPQQSAPEGFHQQQPLSHQQDTSMSGQKLIDGNQFVQNAQPHQTWGKQETQQLQKQKPNNQQKSKPQYQREPQISGGTQSQQQQFDNYNQQSQNKDDNTQVQNTYNQQYQNYQSGGAQNNPDYTNNKPQEVYQPFHPSQTDSQNFNYSSKYKSATFATDPSSNKNTYNQQQQYGNAYNSNDRNQYLQQQGGAEDGQFQPQTENITHDNTYSFTSANPYNQNKSPEPDYQQNETNIQATTTVPAQPTYVINAAGRKILNPNVDTNPNGISVDITDQIQMKRFQQKSSALAQQKQQAQQQESSLPAQRENIQNPVSTELQPQPDYSQQQNIHAQGVVNPIPKNTQQGQQFFQPQPHQNSQQYPNQVVNQTQSMAPQVQQNQYQLKFPPQQYQQGQQFQNQKYPLQQSAPSVQQHQQQVPQEQSNQYQYPMQQQTPIQINQLNNYPPLQNNGSQQIPDKQKIQNSLPIQQNNQNSRQKSQQSQQSASLQQPIQKIPINQNEQTNPAGNYGVPIYRKPSQQQMQQFQPLQQENQIPQGNQIRQEINYPQQYNQNGYTQIQNNENQNDQTMQIEESQNINQSGANNSVNTSAITTIVTKKRGSVGGAKRGKKDTEEKQKLPEVPLKISKSTKQKADKKGKKKQTNDENMEEEQDQGISSNLHQAEIQMKDEQTTFQQPKLHQQEYHQVNGLGQNNNVPARFGSENNIVNKFESQDSMDFQSQTSLGNQVHRQNVQLQKEIKFNPPQLQKYQEQQVNQQPILSKQPPFQQPNLPHVTQDNQSVNGVQPSLAVERQPVMNQNPELQPQQFPRIPSDTKVQPPHLQQFISKQQNAMQFEQARQNTAQGFKKKVGPLVNAYQPFFVELVDRQFQQQQLIKQYRQNMQQYVNQQNGNQKQQIQQLSAPSPQNNVSEPIPQGQIPVYPQMLKQNGLQQQQQIVQNNNPQLTQIQKTQQLKQQQIQQQKQIQQNLTQQTNSLV